MHAQFAREFRAGERDVQRGFVLPGSHVLGHVSDKYRAIYLTFTFVRQMRETPPDLNWHRDWIIRENDDLVVSHLAGKLHTHSETTCNGDVKVLILRAPDLPEVVGRIYFQEGSRYFGRGVAISMSLIRERLTSVPGRSLIPDLTRKSKKPSGLRSADQEVSAPIVLPVEYQRSLLGRPLAEVLQALRKSP